MRAMIVGAGIGGLTAAIALRRAGIDATVFERAGEIEEVGAGILLAANAVGRWANRPLPRSKPTRYARVCWPDPLLAWGDARRGASRELERMVWRPERCCSPGRPAELLAERGGQEECGSWCGVLGFEQDDAGVDVIFADGAGERGELLIGADGLYSTVRARVCSDGRSHAMLDNGLAGGRRTRSRTTALGHGFRDVGEGRQVRLRPHRRRRQGVLVRHQKCTGG